MLLLRAESQFVSNHIWHCHHTVISCPDTNSTATRSWRSNRIFSERVWRYKGTVTVPPVISTPSLRLLGSYRAKSQVEMKLVAVSRGVCVCVEEQAEEWLAGQEVNVSGDCTLMMCG